MDYERVDNNLGSLQKGDVVAWKTPNGHLHYAVLESVNLQTGTINVIIPGPKENAVRHVEDVDRIRPLYRVIMPNAAPRHTTYQKAIKYLVHPLSSAVIAVSCSAFAYFVANGNPLVSVPLSAGMCAVCDRINDKIKRKKLR